MSEIGVGLLTLVGIVHAAVAATFWMFGGRSIEELKKWHLDLFGDKSNRVWGRVIAPIFFAIGVALLSLVTHWSWWYLLGFATYIGVAHLGYGGKTLFQKIWRRALWSVLFTAASLPYVFGAVTPKIWILYITQVLIGLIVSVIWGVTNPTLAPREEYVIKLFNIIFVPLMVL